MLDTSAQVLEGFGKAFAWLRGNVGWLDWTPPDGGTSELNNSIQTPTSPAIPLPSWQNQWYRRPSFAHFQLCISADPACTAVGASFGAYVNGNSSAVCDTGNGATACLVDKFVSIESSGTIGAGFGGRTGNSKAIGVQLIK